MSYPTAFPKQRGIYSEKIAPEVANNIADELKVGPGSNMIIRSNVQQGVPKATSIKVLAGRSTSTGTTKEQPRPLDNKYERERFHEGFYSKIKDGVAVVEPKVMEPYEPIPGRVPRKVAIDRKRKEFASFNIENLLKDEDVDFNAPPGLESWLKLEFFDDKTYDDYSNEEWIEKGRQSDGTMKGIPAKALHKDSQTNTFAWKEILINHYNSADETFSGYWVETQEPATVSRIQLCFDVEDPRKFAKRVANAYQQRIQADSLIRYNYYIDNMPIQDLNDLDTEQKQRLQNLSCSTKALKEKPDMVQLTMEVSGDFSRTMNKIIFDKYLEEDDEKDVTLNNLCLPSQIKNKEAPYLGMIPLERNAHSKDFTEIFKDFCFASLYIKEEVIHALQEIKYECTKVVDMKLFDLLVSNPMRVEEFKHRQDSTTSLMLYHLKGPWADELKNIVTRQFSGVGKGWFSITDTSQTTYDFGKLKRFLTLMRLEMQDVLLTVAKREFYAFYNTIEYYVPESVEVVRASTVHNTFKPDPTLTPEKDKRGALFQIDLIKHSHENKFMYSTSLEKIVDQICDVFENAVAGLGKVQVLEPKILPELYNRSGKEAFIKAPMLRKNEPPPEPDPNEKPKKLPDENKWIYQLYWKLRGLMQKAIKPLNGYLESFEPFKEILQLNPDNHVKLIENEDNPRPVEAIRDEILQINQKMADLRKVIPEEIHVSCFVVSCKDLLQILITKYETLQKNLTDLIAKRARESTQAIFIQFNQIQAQVKTTPKDIEGLTRLKEYISDIPNKIEKIKIDINSCIDIYAMLDDFQYRFAADDLNKKWQIFGGPKDTMELVETRKTSLEKEKTKFQESMLVLQEEFGQDLENLEKTILGFHQYSNLNQHDDVATNVNEVNESLRQYEAKAKQYNQHEMLFGMDLSDYSKIPTMAKEFQAYSNFWLTAHNWFKYSEHWMKCEWKDLDAPFAEQWMEDRVRIMNGVIRWLKDRNIGPVLAIAEKIKQQLDEFKPKVPLMVALRKDGMTDRHWDEIYQKTGIQVKIGEGFTFQTVLDLGLLAYTDKCVEIGERAAKEYAIETQLKKMLEEWKNVEFNISDYKNTNTCIIKGYDEIGALLDEHIQATQAMSFSPFKKPFETEIADWIKTLIEMSDILEEWSKVQSQWMYLQPIFDSPDIAKQLANASKRFKNVDSTWRHTMSAAKNIRNVLQICKMQESTSSLLDKLQEANKTLEAIQKELADYLERKREALRDSISFLMMSSLKFFLKPRILKQCSLI